MARRTGKTGVKTSLVILSRAVNLTCIKAATISKEYISDSKFQTFVDDRISEIKIEEKKHGGALELISNITGSFERLPFLFYYPTEPPGATLRLIGIDPTGVEVPVRSVAYVEEIKNNQHISRNLENGEI